MLAAGALWYSGEIQMYASVCDTRSCHATAAGRSKGTVPSFTGTFTSAGVTKSTSTPRIEQISTTRRARMCVVELSRLIAEMTISFTS